jgi:hypothetical protein
MKRFHKDLTNATAAVRTAVSENVVSAARRLDEEGLERKR